jgi:hypothetical protein
MSPEDLSEAFEHFWQDLLVEADATGDSQNEAFFRLYAGLAAENGDCLDLAYMPARREGRGGFQIDGYAIDADRGELQIAICDLHPERALQTLNAAELKSLTARMERFCEKTVDPGFLLELDESSPAWQVANHIRESRSKIRRIRCLVFSNARLAIRRKTIEAARILGLEAAINVMDFARYSEMMLAQAGFDPIEIDIEEMNGGPLPCLQAHLPGGDYRSFLAVVPGELLANLYGMYGTRLMEQNVRTFLQVKTKVNKGINQTIRQDPGMFFAYNNGITATATDVVVTDGATGSALRSISNLQIVNGGQTTASLLQARDKNGADLSGVFVQMKLSVVQPELVEKIVPDISRYANTQNRISESDFFSAHPFHVEMEKFSKTITPPVAPGDLVARSWFYERARGQYANAVAALSGAARRRFEAEYPRKQVVRPKDLAKYVLSFECRPHIVSQGEQKCIVPFAHEIGEIWEKGRDRFNENYYRQAISQTILFRYVDEMIGRAEWYRAYRADKAAIIAYTIAWLTNHLRQFQGQELDLARIWSEQAVPQEVRSALEVIAPAVADRIRSTPYEIKRVSDYVRDARCWADVSRLEVRLDETALLTCCVSLEQAKALERDAVRKIKVDTEVEFDSVLLQLIPRAREIRAFAVTNKLLSPLADKALKQLETRAMSMTRSDRNALKNLFERIDKFGGGDILNMRG